MSKPDSSPLLDACRKAPIVPVLTLDDAEQGRRIADALVAGGLLAVEVTLRTPGALDALTAMRTAQPSLFVGAGTILTAEHLDDAVHAGADFIVTPGSSPRLRDALNRAPVPVMPGIATISEAMAALEWGFEFLKFFPAGPMGGTGTLKSFAGPLPQAQFMPTGGISEDTVKSYIDLPNVFAAGGTWIAKLEDVRAGDWAGIEARARAALQAATG